MEDLHLHGVIGRGAFGTVYSGEYKGSTVAVKELHDEVKVEKETNIMVGLVHPNIINIITCHGRFIVMDLMTGGVLLMLLKMKDIFPCMSP